MQYLYLAVISLILAAVFIAIEKMGHYLVADVVKGIASAFFVALGILGSIGSGDPVRSRWIICGLVLGAVADVLLNLRYVYEGKKAQMAFVGGTLVFLLGHIAYLIACIPYCTWLPVGIVAGALLTAGLIWWIFQRIEASLGLKVFGVFYLGAISILNCVALVALAAHPSQQALMFLGGAILFLVSDVILILNTFGRESRFTMRVSNLMLYYVGQLMIALSLQLPL